MKVAVIGAGLAGLSAARHLAEAGQQVTVIDKGRGPGGRCATRRSPAGRFDHGAPLLHGLPIDLGRTYGDTLSVRNRAHLPIPTVNALPKALADGLDLHLSQRVTALAPMGQGWHLELEGETLTTLEVDCVMMCIPAPQLVELVPEGLFDGLDAVAMSPIWTLMCGFSVEGSRRGALTLEHGHQAERQNDLPGRMAGGDRWVVHAAADWSQVHVTADRDEVAAELLQALQTAIGLGEPEHIALHRWLYARTKTPLGRPCLWNADQRIGAAGDWCLGPYAGDAITSGRALAEAVLARV